ncbi:hypothetical protein QTP70_001786, partial [Hemibagrus guttatus]
RRNEPSDREKEKRRETCRKKWNLKKKPEAMRVSAFSRSTDRAQHRGDDQKETGETKET